jgi:predicted kinase
MRPGEAALFCGKMAAGKSTLSKALARQEQAILLVQDAGSRTCFPEILDVPDYIRCSAG